MRLYQIAVIIISTLMIYQGLDNFFKKGKNQTFPKLLVRLFVWGGIITIVTYPEISVKIAKFIGIEGNINAVILVGFILVFLFMFKLLSAIEKLEQKITEVTRKETLKDLKK